MISSDNADWVPEALDTMEPGHELGCVLSTLPKMTADVQESKTPSTATATPMPKTPAPAVTTTPAQLSDLWDWADLSPYQQAMLPAFADDVERFAQATR